MADEELAMSPISSPTAGDNIHKRKLEDLELNHAPLELTVQSVAEANSDPESPENKDENGGIEESEAKRPRLEENNGDNRISETETHVLQNGDKEEERADEIKGEEAQQSEVALVNDQSLDADDPLKEALETVAEEPDSNVTEKPEDDSIKELQQPEDESVEEPQQAKEEAEKPSEGVVPAAELQPVSDTDIISRQIEVPTDKVGVLIGKAGDTIRTLQDNSGAKIQIVKDADADPQASLRPVDLVGTLESISKAEKLIRNVIAEAVAGGSPSLAAKGFSTVQAPGGAEQLEMQVPMEKVGLIIGKGGETIRNMQTRSGARIQILQQNIPEGDKSTERTVRVSGNKRQIENAVDMIKEAMNQTARPSPLSGGYGNHTSRPRGPAAPQWGPHNPHQSSYDYPQRGGSYGNYPSQQQGPRNNFGANWDQRPAAPMHGPSSQRNYNYGQQQQQQQQQGPAAGYGHPPPYSQPSPQSSYGYNNQNTPSQNFAPMGGSQQQPPYNPQQSGYGKPYGNMPPPSYAPPIRPTQPGETIPPYQAPGQPYGQTLPPQQPSSYPQYPQQNYPTDGYNQPPANSGYPPPQQQPVSGYVQQPPSAYPQPAPTGGYGSYPTAQPTTGYAEQPSVNSAAAYGAYPQGQADATTYGASQGYHAPAAQSGYAQTQTSYDPSGGGYGGGAPGPAPQPAAYPQYDASQAYRMG